MQVRLCLSGDGPCRLCFFFFNDTATTEIYTLSLHDALPISMPSASTMTSCGSIVFRGRSYSVMMTRVDGPVGRGRDRKSTRLNSSHDQISYAVFCLKKKHANLSKFLVEHPEVEPVSSLLSER